MNEPGSVTDGSNGSGAQAAGPVFISYASADRKEALSVCNAIERRGRTCWISCRDVAPGQNYQEEIVRSLRSARAMVLVFSDAANNSDEIKKELSLASRNHIPVMALRIEDTEPSDAFAYELSTRQWIDAFEGWDKSIDSLVRQIDQIGPAAAPSASAPIRASWRPGSKTGLSGRSLAIASVVVALIVAGVAAWAFLRPAPAAAHSMMVRLTGFNRLSPDIPASMPDAIRDEITAAFNDDGVVGVSNAAAPPSGDAPAYALGGTIRRDGDKIKVFVQMTNERSGATLWSYGFNYDPDQVARIPRHIAVDAGNMVRCGLFAASTYNKALADPVLSDYMRYCENSGFVEYDSGKSLASAQKVVTAAPDFSWGWSAVAGSAGASLFDNPTGPDAAANRRQAAEAAAKALKLDKSNSEALDIQAMLVDPRDVLGQEKLFKAALAARPLACGCEHHLYGMLLQNVGRNREAVEQFRRSTEVLALDFDSQLSLAGALLLDGKADEAKTHFDAAVDLSTDSTAADQTSLFKAPISGDYTAGLKALQNPKLKMNDQVRAAMQASFQAMISGDAAAKTRALQLLKAIPPDKRGGIVTSMFAAFGDTQDAMQNIDYLVSRLRFGAVRWLYFPTMRSVLNDPGFPAFAQKLGLMTYWKTTHSKPEVCSAGDAPPFCRMI